VKILKLTKLSFRQFRGKLLAVGLFVLTINSLCFGQRALTGRIIEHQTNNPVVGASIYFSELLRGTTSDENGFFKMDGLKQGKTLLQVSHIGYQNYFTVIDILQDSVLEVVLKPSLIEMKEVVVYGTQSQEPTKTTFNVAQLTQNEIQQSGALNISDAMARLPGVNQLTTGVGISKPVIRGLYGNRIQVNVSGLRFDNQQWQDEHGLGLSDMGVDRLEVIKGPMSVLYGSDAIGGVINVIEEKPAPVGSYSRDFGARIYSNTFGVSLNYGVKKSSVDRWKIFRYGLDNHADYSDGNNSRVLNSRFASYNLKAAWGKTKDDRTRVVRVAGSFSEFGFVFDSLSRKAEDARLSRTFDGPHHLVGFGQATVENTVFKNGKKIKLNGGVISNIRLEDEGGGGISLSMLLNTLNGVGQITKPVGENAEWTYGSSLMFQTNTNFGGRIIVPDAITGEGSVFSFYKNHLNRFLLEAGARYDLRFIETFVTNTLNKPGNPDSPTDEIFPFRKVYHAFNLSAGAGFNFTDQFYFRSNISTGYRPGNLAELSSNGLHEGTLRWEIGLQKAKVEQNLNVEASLNFSSPNLRAQASLYRNQFQNFFYLAPTGEEYFGFGIYRYGQSDAVLQGGELSFDWNPPGTPLSIGSSYSFIEGKKEDGDALPFIPANKLLTEIKFHFKQMGNFLNPALKVGGTYISDQTKPAQFETKTDGYFLIHAGLSGQWKKAALSLTANNLLNNTYYDHLSRFKYYGIANMGCNVVLSLNYKF
jgi:iron complex outermembrane receptor protein